MTGEAFFSLSSYINKQSFCYWAEASARVENLTGVLIWT
jgi:hypothetical protein